MAHLKTMIGRENDIEEGTGANGIWKIKKDKKPGPASYTHEAAFHKLSTTERTPIT